MLHVYFVFFCLILCLYLPSSMLDYFFPVFAVHRFILIYFPFCILFHFWLFFSHAVLIHPCFAECLCCFILVFFSFWIVRMQFFFYSAVLLFLLNPVFVSPCCCRLKGKRADWNSWNLEFTGTGSSDQASNRCILVSFLHFLRIRKSLTWCDAKGWLTKKKTTRWIARVRWFHLERLIPKKNRTIILLSSDVCLRQRSISRLLIRFRLHFPIHQNFPLRCFKIIHLKYATGREVSEKDMRIIERLSPAFPFSHLPELSVPRLFLSL